MVHLDPSIEALGPGAEAAVRSAFEVWYSAGVDLPQVHFAKTPVVDAEAGPDGLNTVSAKPLETPGHEHDLAITATYRNLNTGEVTEADIIINSRKPWGGLSDAEEECENHFDLPSVLVHEAGHFFGLRDESTDHTSTMYLVTNACEIHKRTLTGSDIQTVNELYADGFEDQPEIQCSAAARPDVPPPSGAIMLAILACLGVIRRRQRGMPAAA